MCDDKDIAPCGCEIVRGLRMLKPDGTWIEVTALYYPVELSPIVKKEDNEDNRA